MGRAPLCFHPQRAPPSTLQFLFVTMGNYLSSLSMFSLFIFLSLSSAAHLHQPRHPQRLHQPRHPQRLYQPRHPGRPHHQRRPSPAQPSDISAKQAISLACKATRNPEKCEAPLVNSNNVPPNPTPIQIIELAVRVASEKVKAAELMLQPIVDSYAGDPIRLIAAKNCLEIHRLTEYRLSRTAEVLPRGDIKNARAWMSAVVTYAYDCWSAWKNVSDSQTVAFLESLIELTTNALSMIVSYDRFGNEIGKWKPPGTERVGDWEVVGGPGPGLGYKGGFPSGLKPDVTVCKGGSGCNFGTVQEAVNAAPNNLEGVRRFVIRIKEGVFEETVRVPMEKRNVVFWGEGMGKTVITGSLNVGQPGMNTYNTATVGVLGDGFMARGLTIKNTAGSAAQQAVAFRSDSDLSVIENCEFIGNQDTIYSHSLRQFYKSCRIQGNVDFIMGNSAAIFQDCLILISSRTGDNNANAVTAVAAHGRIDPALSTGFVFQNCVVTGTDEYNALRQSKPNVHQNFLGRPWKEFSRTVFINCKLEALITPEGWMPWSGDFALKTLYYGEFGNSGPGADLSKRVPWSSQIPADRINMYSVQNFIQGDKWIPSS
ncbi:probable pectinesterase/pectinesterase inhibitor 51 [Cornus florida]|uniref:probable pectinesterase/pectinesterase inhibitor 51 n=1 Tax=Cornus florida TaxID=4283 RepID=UPI00289A1259|nr:probable pectinesterase/pectinesterase inhibitor 51 [Cornus florida]